MAFSPSKPFQSTLSVRRATRIRNLYNPPTLFQSTLSVRRATQGFIDALELLIISIHALRKESDLVRVVGASSVLISIHALRKESDYSYAYDANCARISIHALRKESDRHGSATLVAVFYFNPRSP